MAYWIFKCNLDEYRLAERLADPNPIISWRVTRYREEIHEGDTVFIWETGPYRGIRAVMRVDQDPREMAELEAEQPHQDERDPDQLQRDLEQPERRTATVSPRLLLQDHGPDHSHL